MTPKSPQSIILYSWGGTPIRSKVFPAEEGISLGRVPPYMLPKTFVVLVPIPTTLGCIMAIL